jgi:HEPN domain-containing protein
MDNVEAIKAAWEWLDYADADLGSAKILKDAFRDHKELSLYHCQQAAEKYLKGFLVSKAVKYPHIHALDNICAKCSEFDTTFDGIIKECAFLTNFATNARYPFELDVTAYQVDEAITAVEKIRDVAPLSEIRKQATKLMNQTKDACV